MSCHGDDADKKFAKEEPPDEGPAISQEGNEYTILLRVKVKPTFKAQVARGLLEKAAFTEGSLSRIADFVLQEGGRCILSQRLPLAAASFTVIVTRGGSELPANKKIASIDRTVDQQYPNEFAPFLIPHLGFRNTDHDIIPGLPGKMEKKFEKRCLPEGKNRKPGRPKGSKNKK